MAASVPLDQAIEGVRDAGNDGIVSCCVAEAVYDVCLS